MMIGEDQTSTVARRLLYPRYNTFIISRALLCVLPRYTHRKGSTTQCVHERISNSVERVGVVPRPILSAYSPVFIWDARSSHHTGAFIESERGAIERMRVRATTCMFEYVSACVKSVYIRA